MLTPHRKSFAPPLSQMPWAQVEQKSNWKVLSPLPPVRRGQPDIWVSDQPKQTEETGAH